jgi:hypothetical protein
MARKVYPCIGFQKAMLFCLVPVPALPPPPPQKDLNKSHLEGEMHYQVEVPMSHHRGKNMLNCAIKKHLSILSIITFAELLLYFQF